MGAKVPDIEGQAGAVKGLFYGSIKRACLEQFAARAAERLVRSECPAGGVAYGDHARMGVEQE